MKYREINKELHKHTWWSEEAPAVPLNSVWVRQYVQQQKYWHPRLPSMIVCFFKNEFVFEETPEDEKLEIWHYLWEKHQKNPGFMKKRYRQWQVISRRVKLLGEQFTAGKKTWSNRQLAASLLNLSEQVKDHWRMTWMMECADIFTTYELPKLLRKELLRLSPEKINELAISLTSPDHLSFMEHYRLEFIGLACGWHEAIRRGTDWKELPLVFQKRLEKMAERFVWISSNYRQGRSVTKQDIWKQLKEEISHKSPAELARQLASLKSKVQRTQRIKADCYRRYRLSRRLTNALKLLTFWASWIDQRKELALHVNWYLDAYAVEAGQRLGKPLWQMRHLVTDELGLLLRTGRMVPVPVLRQRRKFCTFVSTNIRGKVTETIYYKQQAQKIWRGIFWGRFWQRTKAEKRARIYAI